MRPILNSPRILRTGQPLTLAGIQQVCPAVFAKEPHNSRGPRYLYVPTIDPLQALLDTGWGVYEASQQRSRAADKDPYTKHMLRLRKLEHFDNTQTLREGVPEVILINAHDGTAAYHLRAGFFRFVCANGLIVGNNIAGFKIRDGVPIGCMVTLRGTRMYEFLDRFVTVALPRVRDFRGISGRSFDGRGNYNVGVREQIIFPEIDYDKVDAIRGLNISITTSAKTDEECKALLAAFKFPFKN